MTVVKCGFLGIEWSPLEARDHLVAKDEMSRAVRTLQIVSSVCNAAKVGVSCCFILLFPFPDD